jgi:hypothetical protein
MTVLGASTPKVPNRIDQSAKVTWGRLTLVFIDNIFRNCTFENINICNNNMNVEEDFWAKDNQRK